MGDRGFQDLIWAARTHISDADGRLGSATVWADARAPEHLRIALTHLEAAVAKIRQELEDGSHE